MSISYHRHTLRSAPRPTLGNKYGRTLPFFTWWINDKTCQSLRWYFSWDELFPFDKLYLFPHSLSTDGSIMYSFRFVLCSLQIVQMLLSSVQRNSSEVSWTQKHLSVSEQTGHYDRTYCELLDIVWRLRGNIIRTALCWIVWRNVHTYMSSSYKSIDWVCHIGTLMPYVEAVAWSCIIVTWWSGSGEIQVWSGRLTGVLQCFDSVGLVTRPVKIVPVMTYNVLIGMLSPYTTSPDTSSS